MQILLAEDNPTNQLVAMQMLESLGAEVTLAVDGAEALDRLEDQQFDVALIDIEMPRVSGIELIERVRADPRPISKMPLIALTAYVMREHRVAIDTAGADGIIAKPILSIEQFGEDIRRFVEARVAAATLNEELQSPVAAPSGTNEGIDTEVFRNLCSSFDGPALKELITNVGNDIQGAGTRLADAIKIGDHSEIRAASHILISVGGAIGAFNLQQLAQCLNSAGHAFDNEAIGRDGPMILAEIESVLAFIRGEQEG
jgi:CheY-like chemotaxis protein